MGSIRNTEDQVVVTFEVERLLQEPVRMMREGKFQKNDNITMADMVGWVLWSLMSRAVPKMDFSRLGPMQVTFDKEGGNFMATMKKQG